MEILCKLEILVFLSISSYSDYKKKIVNTSVCICAMVIFIISALINRNILWYTSISGFAFGGILIFLSYITKGDIGIGDGVVLSIVGILEGFLGNAKILMTSLIICMFVSLFLIVIKKVGKKYKIPFVPFILAGYVLNMLY